MPPRIPTLSAVRPAQTYIKTQVCQFSRTTTSQALRDVNTPSTSAGILDLDSPNPNRERGARGDRSGIASSIFSSFRASKQRNQAPVGEELKVEDQLRGKMVSEDYIRQTGRRWTLGDVYAPHDLSGVEQKKWKAMSNIQKDLVDLLGLKPLDMYRNFSFISEYITAHGRIKKADHTGLRPVNQRKVAKAIRRAIGLGLHPSVHKHPEILKRERRIVGVQNSPTGKFGNRYSV